MGEKAVKIAGGRFFWLVCACPNLNTKEEKKKKASIYWTRLIPQVNKYNASAPLSSTRGLVRVPLSAGFVCEAII